MKISVAQVDAGLIGPENRFRWLELQARQAVQAGSDIIVFPELYMSGYNVGEALQQRAEAQDGPYAQRVAALAKDLGVAIAYGYPERGSETVYNAFIFIDAVGKTLANHRKTVLPAGIEHEWFATGSGFPVFRFGDAMIAMVICYECEFPEIVRNVALDGADIVLIATAGGKDWAQVPKIVVPARAYENGLFLVYANYCGIENGHGYCGHSCIVDPYGYDLARAGKTEEVIAANLNLGLIAEVRAKVQFLKDLQGVASKMNYIAGI